MIVLGQRRDDGRWQVLDVPSVNAVRPEGAWKVVLEIVERMAGPAEVIEYRVPPPAWKEVEVE